MILQSALTLENLLKETPLDFLLSLPGGKPVLFLLLVVLVFTLLSIISFLLVRVLRFLAGKTKTTLDDELIAVSARYLNIVSVFFALFFSLYLVYPDLQLGEYTEFEVFVIIFLGVLAFFIADIIDVFMIWYGMKIQPKERKTSPKQVFPFVRTIVRVLIYCIFAIFILQFAGFDTAALLTGLGVAGLAVALALQDTLGNFFAGIHILMDKPFKEGDYIRMETGMEGTVDRIGWRTTKIITPEKNELIVPN
ncbi:MAG: mechanosensitive ion channel, partial [Candidatus Bilamarchaeaceae archaeon]